MKQQFTVEVVNQEYNLGYNLVYEARLKKLKNDIIGVLINTDYKVNFWNNDRNFNPEIDTPFYGLHFMVYIFT